MGNKEVHNKFSFLFFIFYFFIFFFSGSVDVRDTETITSGLGKSEGACGSWSRLVLQKQVVKRVDLRARICWNSYQHVEACHWSNCHKIFGERRKSTDEENCGGGEMNITASTWR